VSKRSVTGFMDSLLNRILMPMVLVGCLAFVFSQSDPEPPESTLDQISIAPAVTPSADIAEFLPVKERVPLMRFGGYPCRDDCSEHRQGYQWARENGISEPDNCDGLSAGFIEGCRVYAESRTVAVAALNWQRDN
jgi:hypothetical protein